MNPKELRIGNYVWYDCDTYTNRKNKIANNVFAVSYLYSDVVGIDIGYGATQKFQHNPIISADIDDLKPIYLTNEWLERFGFDNSIDELNNEEEEQFITEYFNSDSSLSVEINEDSSVTITLYADIVDELGQLAKQGAYELEFDNLDVHQLQNLYFAFKGNELLIINQ